MAASTFLLASCATQKYSSIDNLTQSLSNIEYNITQEMLEKEIPTLDSLATRYNAALKNIKTIPTSEFDKIMKEYTSQKAKVQKYEDILKINKYE